jgi:predicted dehydrogenase
MSVKWGILSTADINRKLLAGAAESDDVEVVAVGSRDLVRAEEFARTWGIDRAYGTYDELLADPDVEAVYIPLPNTMHSEWSIRSLEAGKHVLCEKPFSRHIADVERAFDAAEATGLHLSEAFMYRHHPQTARLAELVTSGAIGELRVIRSAFGYSLYDAGNIRLRTDVEGGALMDVGCYCVSGARLLGGEPESVVGAAHIGSSGTDWVFTGLLRFPGDVLALLDCGTALPERDELEAIGTEGSLFLDDPWHCPEPVIEWRTGDTVERIEVEAANPYRPGLEDLNAAIRGERPPLLGRADALGQVRTIDALFRSAAGGQTVKL